MGLLGMAAEFAMGCRVSLVQASRLGRQKATDLLRRVVWAWRADARLTKVVRVKQEQEESVQDELGVAKTHIAAYKDTITTLGEGDTLFAGDRLKQGISRPQPGQKS